LLLTEYDKSGISQINPDEIESLTVLKDASSAAIYGQGVQRVLLLQPNMEQAAEQNFISARTIK